MGLWSGPNASGEVSKEVAKDPFTSRSGDGRSSRCTSREPEEEGLKFVYKGTTVGYKNKVGIKGKQGRARKKHGQK